MKKLLFPFLVLIVIGIGLLHFFTPAHYIFFHDTYRRLSYFPIVLGAIWFGVRGGLSLAILSSIAFIPHLLLYFGQAPQTYLSELTEIILYLAAGGVTGVIAGREARLRKKYEELSEKLERSYGRLHKQAKILLEVEEQLGASQRLSALGRLSASLAHEIKNPLSSIRGTAEIFLDEFPPGHPKHEFVEILLKEVARLNTTVEDVLRFSRGKTVGSSELEPVSEVLERTAKLLAHHLQKKNITLHPEGMEVGKDFEADGAKLSQVLLNIALNAIDALPPGGNIWLRVRLRQKGLAITICDDGPGIDDARKEQIFTPFFTTKEGGTGLGLPISRRIVESHGGTLTCTDSPHGGACFTIFLPRRKEHAADQLLDDMEGEETVKEEDAALRP